MHGNLRYFCGMKTIAHIHTDFPTKFGIPRQSGIIASLQGKIVFEPEYRIPEGVLGGRTRQLVAHRTSATLGR